MCKNFCGAEHSPLRVRMLRYFCSQGVQTTIGAIGRLAAAWRAKRNHVHILACYAAAPEGARVSLHRPDSSLRLGVGKIEATLSLVRALEARAGNLPDAVLLFGVCGAYPAGHGIKHALAVGDLCVVGTERLGDEGVCTPQGFLDLEALGLGDTGPFVADTRLCTRIAQSLEIPVVAGVTVSRCSGRDELSRDLVSRCGAQVESMEGAAVARVCGEYRIPFIQLRCVSNMTGDRDPKTWDLEGSCLRIQDMVLQLMKGLLCDA